MKIQLVSDLHLEMWDECPIDLTDADVLIVAGDVTDGRNCTKAKIFIEQMCDHYPEVIMVPGNHDYYFREMNEQDYYWNNYMPDNFIYLNCGHIIKGDHMYMIHGCTLWSDISNPLDRHIIVNSLSDFEVIPGMTGNAYQSLHLQHKMWLDESISLFENNFKHIVITHHAPHPLSIHKNYKYFNNNAGFISNLDYMFLKHDIKLWMHGHVHNSMDYYVDNTRVLCNPVGYGYENMEFNRRLIIEVK